MRKSFVTMGLVLAISATSTFTAFAGWEQTGATWKYNSNGTYFNNGWNWIDGNGDGIAECYYFNADGIMLASTTTPDNFTVNEQGAWTVNGVVQTQPAPQPTQPVVQPTQPAPQPTEAYVEPQPDPVPNNTIPDTSTYTSPGKIIFDDTPLSSDQHLSPEQEKAINEVQFN